MTLATGMGKWGVGRALNTQSVIDLSDTSSVPGRQWEGVELDTSKTSSKHAVKDKVWWLRHTAVAQRGLALS